MSFQDIYHYGEIGLTAIVVLSITVTGLLRILKSRLDRKKESFDERIRKRISGGE